MGFVWVFVAALTSVSRSKPFDGRTGIQLNGQLASMAQRRKQRIRPSKWDAAKNANWVAELPGTDSATPNVRGHQVFLQAPEETTRSAPTPPKKRADFRTEPPEGFDRSVVTSLDRSIRETIWKKVATEQVPSEGRHPTLICAAGSPTPDGDGH